MGNCIREKEIHFMYVRTHESTRVQGNVSFSNNVGISCDNMYAHFNFIELP